MNIEIITTCYTYHRRFLWLLSSLVQQTYLPNITINVVYLLGGGSPSVERLVTSFGAELKFRTIGFNNSDDIAFKGWLKNVQIAASREEWLLFLDIDHIFPPFWFEKLNNMQLLDRMYYEPLKRYTDPEATQKEIENCGDEHVNNVYQQALQLPLSDYQGRKTPSGNMMLVKRKSVYEKANGRYADPFVCTDKHMLKQSTRSDIYFREKFKIRKLNIGELIHLGHSKHWKERKSNIQK